VYFDFTIQTSSLFIMKMQYSNVYSYIMAKLELKNIHLNDLEKWHLI
jgi:hypothetical protein